MLLRRHHRRHHPRKLLREASKVENTLRTSLLRRMVGGVWVPTVTEKIFFFSGTPVSPLPRKIRPNLKRQRPGCHFRDIGWTTPKL